MFSGAQTFGIRIWPRSHVVMNRSDAGKRKKGMENAASIKVAVPLYSLLVFRSDIVHAGLSGKELLGITPQAYKDRVFKHERHALNIRSHSFMLRKGSQVYDLLHAIGTNFPFKV